MYLGDAVACTAPKRVTPVRQRDLRTFTSPAILSPWAPVTDCPQAGNIRVR
jgi:hypothetical protein